jgi:hypothetical protein
MAFPANWQTPITVQPGQLQANVNPLSLLPSRLDLLQVRLDIQKALLDAGIERHTPIRVTVEGVVWDGHHAIRIAAERKFDVTVKVVNLKINPTDTSIMDLPVE